MCRVGLTVMGKQLQFGNDAYWLIWRVLKLAFFFQKSIFPVFILASGAVRTTPSLCRHIFMRFLIWC